MRYSNQIGGIKRYSDDDKTLYNRWKHMRERCRNPRRKDYQYYGAKGVDVCEEWNSYINFYEWFDTSLRLYAVFNKKSICIRSIVIDRINPSVGYCPENCRLITVSENSRRAIYRRDAKGRFSV